MIFTDISGSFSSYHQEIIPFYSEETLLAATITTSNRYEKCPYLILTHGSSGIGQDICELTNIALKNGYSVITIDHFTPRSIKKLALDGSDLKYVDYFDLYNDTKNFLSDFQHYQDESYEFSVIGLSLGATAAMLLNQPRIKKTYALYPTLRPLTKSLTQIDHRNLTLFVGELDSWTPEKDIHFLNANLTNKVHNIVLKDSHHSFMKRGMDAKIEVSPLGQNPKWDKVLIENLEYKKLFRTSLFRKQLNSNKTMVKFNKKAYDFVIDSFFNKRV